MRFEESKGLKTFKKKKGYMSSMSVLSFRAQILEYTSVFPVPSMLYWEVPLSVKDTTNSQFMGNEAKPIYFCLHLSLKNLFREGSFFLATGLLFFLLIKN